MKSIQTLIMLFGICLPCSAVFGEEAIVSFVGTTFTGSVSDQTLGWRFHLNSPVTLTSLGVYDHLQDGFAEPHEVGLWTSTGTLRADGFLPTGASGTLLNGFRYVDVPDVALPIGDYVIATHYIGQFVDPFSDDNSSLTTHPFVQYQGRNGSPGSGFQFPSNFLGSDGLNFITSNFQFVEVPEPNTLLLFGLATAGVLFRRGRK